MAIRTLKQHAVSRRRKKIAMKHAQDIVPLTECAGGGIFVSDNVYIKTWEFSNINFKLLGREQEEKILRRWCDCLNGLEPGVTYKYTVLKQKLDLDKYSKQRMLPYQDDGKDKYREEYNGMLAEKILDTKLIQEQRFFQAAIKKRKAEDARSFFNRSEPEFEKFFRGVGSDLTAMTDNDYLRVIWQFFHMDSGEYIDQLDAGEMLDKKHTLKDFLAPYAFETDNKEHCIKIGSKYFRALYVPPGSYAKYIKDTVLSELTALDKSMCISVDIMPIETAEAYSMVENLEYRSESNIGKFMERQARHGNFNAQVPYPMRKKSEQIEEYNHDLNERDQRLMLSHITIVHCADSLKELNEDTDALKTTARQQGCELAELSLQQEDGMITALPFGVNRFIGKDGSRLRTLTTESLASFIPFTVQELLDKHGIYYGQNKLNKSPLFIDRKSGMNGNAVILGSSGSGKSFKKKEELAAILLNTNDNVIIIDPEREYTHMVGEMGGQVIRLAADSHDHINALDIHANYNDGRNPVTLKSEFILTLYAMAEGSDILNPKAKSVIDRCVKLVYADYITNGYQGQQPTLRELRDEIARQGEPVATDIALILELYTEGSLNLFSKPTNVDMSNRLICFDICDLGENLMSIAMLVVTDFISNTLSRNREKQVWTWLDVDELYLMFQKEYTATFFFKLWKRIRKYGGLCTGITQELGDLLKSPTARTMLANSDFLILLSANESDAVLIQELLHLDETQMSHITEVGPSNGMIKLGSAYIPFTDDFPKDTQLYQIMSTKFKEDTKEGAMNG
ncbi:VirB4-like conjugal transfer ATPase, CD1110 family [Ihubacter sp. mB4P-1]|uniref:VirB4-like conjugal transfer ATPase, CD1110 family n=1 Tax=Ihubacter sp. mB4P-1 TaxID=3242370 RepID=UPI003C7ED8D9